MHWKRFMKVDFNQTLNNHLLASRSSSSPRPKQNLTLLHLYVMNTGKSLCFIGFKMLLDIYSTKWYQACFEVTCLVSS